MSELAGIQGFVLSGGTGTRLWPLSRRAMPKQFLDLFGDGSLFQQTVQRLGDIGVGRFSVIGSAEHSFILRDQLAATHASAEHLVIEPFGRNTAAAAAAAAVLASQNGEDELVLLLPSDHVIREVEAFRKAVGVAAKAAHAGAIVTFGIVPDHAATGFGYIEVDDSKPHGEDLSALDVVRFTEKPDLATAEEFLAGGRHFWNSGMFLFSAGTMLDAFAAYAPDVLAAVKRALGDARRERGFIELAEKAFEQCPEISVDYAIMEHARHVETVPLEAGWNDLGAWDAVWASGADRGQVDRNGNVTEGDVVTQDCANSLFYSSGPTVAGIGVEDMCVIATPDVVLVMPRKDAQDVGKLVSLLQRNGRDEAILHPRCYRPWGWYERLSIGDRYQVKRIMVKPGAKLSLQSHMHRAEHWVVVSGTATVTVGNVNKTLTENESTYVPLGTVHRLENPGMIPLYMIEVQSGAYLGEDDIQRFEDIYARV